MAFIAIAIVWAPVPGADALLIVYVSGLLAIGFSPIVRMIEQQKLAADRIGALPALAGDSDSLPQHPRHRGAGRLF